MHSAGRPSNPDSASESSEGEDEWEAISYDMVCQILNYHLESSKIPSQIKHKIQVNTADVSEANSSVGIKIPNVVDAQLNEVKLFHSIPPSQMAEMADEMQTTFCHLRICSQRKKT